MSSIPAYESVVTEKTEGAVAPGSRKSKSPTPAASAIKTMQHRSATLARHEADLATCLIETADAILTTIRTMTPEDQLEVWMQAIVERLIPNRREMRNALAALAEIALADVSLSPSGRSQFRAVIRHAHKAGGTVASLVGQRTIWATYKGLRSPNPDRRPAPAPALSRPARHLHLHLDAEIAAQAAAEGALFRIEGDQEGGFRLVPCSPIPAASTAGPVIDGDVEEVSEGGTAPQAEQQVVEPRPWFCDAPFTVSGVGSRTAAGQLLKNSATYEAATDPTTGHDIRIWTLTHDTPEVRAIIAAHDPQPWPRPEVA